ncbi:MAG: hypothetical protein KC448_13645 [Yoonia sp.]|nr:hypothetical protein [Yoonia sp.]
MSLGCLLIVFVTRAVSLDDFWFELAVDRLAQGILRLQMIPGSFEPLAGTCMNAS